MWSEEQSAPVSYHLTYHLQNITHLQTSEEFQEGMLVEVSSVRESSQRG